ncbi:cytochrome c maturation protein CcmE [Novosphingopyxis iocasae]|uniref:cytochrome c maturation protein CcmE n=1 Tax=Novosphingopyxis iocasae TaxID=2762729 RepID=UPI0016510840|nr:cytochrome c maturation protein CcmE [Novosphingopyxis iocasae]
MKAKHQRLTLVVLAVVALIGAGLLAMLGLKDQAAYFYQPAALVKADVPPGQAIRLGGLVMPGTIKHAADGVTTDFRVGDGEATVPVTYRGIVPDLFTEGSGVVATGRMDGRGTFVADNLLAKHDENYVPRELGNIDKAAVISESQTLVK